MKKLFLLILLITAVSVSGIYGFGGKPEEYVPSNDEIDMVVKPFDSDLAWGGMTSIIPRFYYFYENGDKDLQKPEIVNMVISIDGEPVYTGTNEDADFWTKANLLDYSNGEHLIEVSATDVSNYTWNFATNFIVSNFTVTMQVVLAEPLDDPYRKIYLAGSSPQLSDDPDEWDPRGRAMDKISDTIYETELLVGYKEKSSFQITLGNWGTKGRTENNEFLYETIKFMEPGEVVELAIDNWGYIEGELTLPGKVFGFTDSGMNLRLAYSTPEPTNVTLYYTYSPESYWEPIHSELTQYHIFDIPSKFNRELYYILSTEPDETNVFNIPYNNVPFEFVIFGDVQNNTTDISKAVAIDESPAFVVYTGDLVQYGHDLSEWNRFLSVYMKPLLTNTFFQPTLGNHDEESPLYPVITGKPYWYSYSWANCYFLSIDNSAPFDPGTPQYEWIKEELSTVAQYYQFTIVYMHYPPYSVRKHGSDAPSQETLLPLFEEYGVDIVFSGHDHGYQRTYPLLDGEINEEDGIIYVVAAGGGAPLYDIEVEHPYWLDQESKVWHYLRATVDNKEILFEAVNTDGEVFDSFTLEP